MSTDIRPDAQVPVAENGHALVPVSNGNGSMMALPWPYGAPIRPEILSAKPNPMELLLALRRRWPLAVGLGLATGGILAALVWFLMPIKYEAAALLNVSPKQQANMLDQSEGLSMEGFSNYKRTQIQLIKSGKVLNRVLSKPDIQRLALVKKQKDDIGWLEDELMVDFPGDAQILRIAMKGDDVRALTMIVNAVKDAYMSEIVYIERDKRMKEQGDLDKALENTRKEFKNKTDQLKNMEDSLGLSGSGSYEIQKKKMIDELDQLTKHRNELATDLGAITMNLMLVKRQLENASEPNIPEVLLDAQVNQNPQIVNLQQQVTQLRLFIAKERLTTKDGKSRSVKRLTQQLDIFNDALDEMRQEMRAQMLEQYKASMAAGGNPLGGNLPILETKQQALTDALTEASTNVEQKYADLEKLEKTSSDAEGLRSELTELRGVMQTLGQDLRMRAITDLQTPRVTPLVDAEIPKGNDAMRKYLVVAFTGLAGVGLAIFGVAYAEFQSRRVNRGRDVNEGLGIRVMGDLPRLSGRAAKRPELMQAILTESIDSIRTSLIHTTAVQSPRIVMVTSADNSEGKTTVASQLAASLARSGRRTLLVDADVRNPAIHEVFDLPCEPGFSEALRGTIDRSAVIQPTHAPNLWLVPAGRCDMQSIQLLASAQLGAMLKAWREEFEFVIIDIGPVLQVADPLLIGQHVDAAILSAQCDISKMPNVYDACERLKSVGVVVLGAVVNGSCNRTSRRTRNMPLLTDGTAEPSEN
jgi:polysaccharide biosynthesis transport protein